MCCITRVPKAAEADKPYAKIELVYYSSALLSKPPPAYILHVKFESGNVRFSFFITQVKQEGCLLTTMDPTHSLKHLTWAE